MIGAPKPNSNIFFKQKLTNLLKLVDEASINSIDYQAVLDAPFVATMYPINPKEAEARIEGLIKLFAHMEGKDGFGPIKSAILDLYADSIVWNIKYKGDQGNNESEKEQIAVQKRKELLSSTKFTRILQGLIESGQSDVLFLMLKEIDKKKGNTNTFEDIGEYLSKENKKVEAIIAQAKYQKDPLVQQDVLQLNNQRDRFIELHKSLAEKIKGGMNQDQLAMDPEYVELKQIEAEQRSRIQEREEAVNKLKPFKSFFDTEANNLAAALKKLNDEKRSLEDSILDVTRRQEEIKDTEPNLHANLEVAKILAQKRISAIEREIVNITDVAQREKEQKDEVYLFEKMASFWNTNPKTYGIAKKKAIVGASEKADNFFNQKGDLTAAEILALAKQRKVAQKPKVEEAQEPVENKRTPQDDWMDLFYAEYKELNGQEFAGDKVALKQQLTDFYLELTGIYANSKTDPQIKSDLSNLLDTCLEKHSAIMNLDLKEIIARMGAKKYLGVHTPSKTVIPFITSNKYLSVSLEVLTKDATVKQIKVDALKVPVKPVPLLQQKKANEEYAKAGHTKDGVLKIQLIKDELKNNAQVGKVNVEKDSIAGLMIKVSDYKPMFVVADDVVIDASYSSFPTFQIVSESDARKYISGHLDKEGKAFVPREDKPLPDDNSAKTVYYPMIDLLTASQLSRLALFMDLKFGSSFDPQDTEQVTELKDMLQSKLARSKLTMADILYVAIGYRGRNPGFVLKLEEELRPQGYVFDVENTKGDVFFADRVVLESLKQGYKKPIDGESEVTEIVNQLSGLDTLAAINHTQSDQERFEIRLANEIEPLLEPLYKALEKYKEVLDGLEGKTQEHGQALEALQAMVPGETPQTPLIDFLGTKPGDFDKDTGRLALVKAFSEVAMEEFKVRYFKAQTEVLLKEIQADIIATENQKLREKQAKDRDANKILEIQAIRKEIKLDFYEDEDFKESEKIAKRLDDLAEAEYNQRHANDRPLEVPAQNLQQIDQQIKAVQKDIQLARRDLDDTELKRLTGELEKIKAEKAQLERELATAKLLTQQRAQVAQKTPVEVFIETGGDWDKAFQHAAKVSHLDKIDLNEVQKVWISGLKISDVSRKRALNSTASSKVAEYNNPDIRRQKYEK